MKTEQRCFTQHPTGVATDLPCSRAYHVNSHNTSMQNTKKRPALLPRTPATVACAAAPPSQYDAGANDDKQSAAGPKWNVRSRQAAQRTANMHIACRLVPTTDRQQHGQRVCLAKAWLLVHAWPLDNVTAVAGTQLPAQATTM